MNDLTPRKFSGTLLERAAALYPLAALPRVTRPEPRAAVPVVKRAPIDRGMLADDGMIVPGEAATPLAEEFRLVKRQLLITARVMAGRSPDRARTLLVTSPHPGDGKTFCAINLALSLAAERDVEVLLVDADFAQPDVLNRLGVEEGLGLLDALTDRSIDPETLVIRTDVPQLSLLPAGTRTVSDTELLASERAIEVLSRLASVDPNRIVIFDSPPALAASPASVLAGLVGQTMLVVRANRTSESDLRQAVALLDACDELHLVLNSVSLQRGKGRRFGSYYRQDAAA